MKFGATDGFLTGVSVPVSALRSAENCGVGEFADLPLLGRWCAAAGLGVIQILPVNDTGPNSSPYSALSAFALHPLYLRLQAVPGAALFEDEIRAFRQRAEERRRFSYPEVLSFKLSTAERAFNANKAAVTADAGFGAWRAANPWVTAYAGWKSLPAGARTPPAEAAISAIWETDRTTCLLHAWVQYLLEEQLSAASRALRDMGVRLKGDIPILMNEDSVDVACSTRCFDLSLRAGAPPDMYSTDGQNWGFPVYNWEALAADDYAWWKGRLRQAAKFFSAFRIDHVLGFFRIWCIPKEERRGTLGHFSPVIPLTRAELMKAGFDQGRIRWLSVPHFSARELEERLGPDGVRVREPYLDRVGSEELFNFKPGLDSEAALLGLGETPEIRDFLLAKHEDRTLLALSADEFQPAWYFWRSASFQSLGTDEQARLRELIAANRRESERIWEERGRALLGMLRDATDMLVCAEDLGDVPECVPRVLEELGILGLRITRWTRDYKTPGEPFFAVKGFPRLSVCTASVHDTSTLRAWWEENPRERNAYFSHLGLSGICPDRMTRGLLAEIVSRLMEADSLLCIFQLQDLLDLDESNWSPDPRGDRINVPGTVNDENWTWRMPLSMEDLAQRAEPAETIHGLTLARGKRNLS